MSRQKDDDRRSPYDKYWEPCCERKLLKMVNEEEHVVLLQKRIEITLKFLKRLQKRLNGEIEDDPSH